MTHRHEWHPHSAMRGQIVSWCRGCSKRRKQRAVLCPDCDTGGEIGRREGCTRDCFNGYIVAAEAPVCCCSLPREERCQGCLDAAGLIHVCLVATDAEIEDELRQATMPSPKRGRSSAATQAVIDRIAWS